MQKSFTATTFDDEREPDGTYSLDCCNTDYCKAHRKKFFGFFCLMGAHTPRCSLSEKQAIRQEAISNGFKF